MVSGIYNSGTIYHYFNIDVVFNKTVIICMIFAIAKHFFYSFRREILQSSMAFGEEVATEETAGTEV